MAPSFPLGPHTLPATTHNYLLRSAESLSEAVAATDVATRYACAHVAALRAAAALLSARARPAGPRRRAWPHRPRRRSPTPPSPAPPRRGGPTRSSARAAAEAGSSRAVTEREADDLVRDADRFLALVEQSLGLTPHAAIGVQVLGRAAG